MSITYGCRQKRVKVQMPVDQAAHAASRILFNTVPPTSSKSHRKNSKNKDESTQLSEEMFLQRDFKFMPIHFITLPFGFPTDTHPHGDKIKPLLAHSLKIQKEEGVSYHCGFVSAIISACINSITHVGSCSLKLGFRVINDDSRPHVWCQLSPQDFVIDNAYEKFLESDEIEWIEDNITHAYKEGGYSYPNKDEMPSDHEEFTSICYMKTLELFQKQPDKAIALCLNHEQVYLYYFAMLRFMWENFSVNVNVLNPAIRHTCWNCGALPAYSEDTLSDILSISSEHTGPNFKKWRNSLSSANCAKLYNKLQNCSQCMVAVYCNEVCQQVDWTKWHRFVCVSRVANASANF